MSRGTRRGQDPVSTFSVGLGLYRQLSAVSRRCAGEQHGVKTRAAGVLPRPNRGKHWSSAPELFPIGERKQPCTIVQVTMLR